MLWPEDVYCEYTHWPRNFRDSVLEEGMLEIYEASKAGVGKDDRGRNLCIQRYRKGVKNLLLS